MNDEAEIPQGSLDQADLKDKSHAVQLVRAGSVNLGIFADDIATIVAWQEPTPLPHAPKSVLGVVSIQGRMLTVLDLATMVSVNGASSMSATESPQSIVGLRGDEQLALAVATVGDSAKISVADLKLQQDAGALILGTVQLEDSEIRVLNLRNLFPTAIQGRERRRRRF